MGLLQSIEALVSPTKCIFCRRILASDAEPVCEACMDLTRRDGVRYGTYFSRCVTPMVYEGSVAGAIKRFKFQDMPFYDAPLGKVLARCIRDSRLDYALLSWVPVSRKRRRKRGYDQAMLLARAAGAQLGTEVTSTLEKTVHNAPQSDLSDPVQRRNNVRGVYRVPNPELVAGKRILLIDDVFTTGATMEEASRTLLEAGAAEVAAAALAQAP